MVRQGSGSIGLVAPFGRVLNSPSFFRGRVFWVQMTIVYVFTAMFVLSFVVLAAVASTKRGCSGVRGGYRGGPGGSHFQTS